MPDPDRSFQSIFCINDQTQCSETRKVWWSFGTLSSKEYAQQFEQAFSVKGGISFQLDWGKCSVIIKKYRPWDGWTSHAYKAIAEETLRNADTLPVAPKGRASALKTGTLLPGRFTAILSFCECCVSTLNCLHADFKSNVFPRTPARCGVSFQNQAKT